MVSSPARRTSVKVPRSLSADNLKGTTFDVTLFLDSAGLGRKVEKFRGKEIVFSQGDPAKNVLYLQEGAVKLTVVNAVGKEAVVAMLGGSPRPESSPTIPIPALAGPLGSQPVPTAHCGS